MNSPGRTWVHSGADRSTACSTGGCTVVSAPLVTAADDSTGDGFDRGREPRLARVARHGAHLYAGRDELLHHQAADVAGRPRHQYAHRLPLSNALAYQTF